MRNHTIRIVLAIAMAAVAFGDHPSAAARDRQNVIVRTPKPYTAIEAKVVKLGGKVTAKFKRVDAIAVQIPEAGLAQLRAGLPAGSISKDEMIFAPSPVIERPVRYNGGDVNDIADLSVSSVGA